MAAPVALAAGLFTYMVTRTIVSGVCRGPGSMAWPAQQAFPVDTGPSRAYHMCRHYSCRLQLAPHVPVLPAAGCAATCADPDTKHTPGMPIDCLKSSNYGEQWRNSIRGFFQERIRNGHITVFDREVAMPRV